MIRRHRRRFRTTCVVAAVLGCAAAGVTVCPGEAGAQTFGRDALAGRESPQNFAFELRLGGIYPNVDSEFGPAPPPAPPGAPPTPDTRPFHAMFGDGIRFLPAIEFDWQIVRIPYVASLGVGASAGFTTIQANAPFSPYDRSAQGIMRSTEVTGLQMVPTTLVGVLRFDGPSRSTTWFPIVPYAKVGLAWTPWWITNASGYAYVPGDDTGMTNDMGMPIHRYAGGAALGLHFAAGLMLNLGIFEPHVQRQFDATVGVNHSYLFGEIYYTSMFGAALGGTPQLDLSALAWTLGIALEF